MRHRPTRTLLWIMFMVIAVSMAACSGVRRGTAPSFDASLEGHHSGMAAVSEGDDTAARRFQPANVDAAPQGRLPGVVRVAAANAVSTADTPTPFSPLSDDEAVEEYDPWEPFNRRMFVVNRQLDRFVLKPVATVWDQGPPRPGAGEHRSLLHEPQHATTPGQ
jgi:hypothetical protein